MTPRANQPGARSRRWGVILAGGDDRDHLRSVTRSISGDHRPKQFCTLLGEGTLLEQARRRAKKIIPPEQTLVALNHAHQNYYLRDLHDSPCPRLVQPCDRGTAPAILYSLLHIGQIEYDATIAIFPGDHYYSGENAITAGIESAFEIARIQPQSLVLLAAQPDLPEVEYDWLEVGRRVHERAFQVRDVHQKPSRPVAQRLLQSGALWNTCVMVGHIGAFLELAWQFLPGVMELLEIKMKASHRHGEIRLPDSLYDCFPACDFSQVVLSRAVEHLLALPVNGLEWNDLGNPQRVLSAMLARAAGLPGCAQSWQPRFVA